MRQSTLQELQQHQVQLVSGAGIVGDGAGCIGGAIAIAGTDGALALTGLGIATAGACFEFGGDIADSFGGDLASFATRVRLMF